MVEETASAIAEILRAAELFQAAKIQQFRAIGVLFEVYLRAKDNPAATEEIRTSFDELDAELKPRKCKTLSGMISWVAFPHSKQRVSEARKLIEAAPANVRTAEEFSNWVETSGGIRALLLSLCKPRNDSASGSKAKPLYEVCHDVIESLTDHSCANTRYESRNPVDHKLVDGQIHIQVVEYTNGKYRVFDALLLDSELKFPPRSEQPPKQAHPFVSIGKLADLAQSDSPQQSLEASSAA